MSDLDRFIPTPRLLEADHLDLKRPPAQVWQALRHGDIGKAALLRALFAVRERRGATSSESRESLTLDDLLSSSKRPGLTVLVEEAPHALIVGGVGKVWHLEAPFVHVAPREFPSFQVRGYVKLVCGMRLVPWGEGGTRLTVEVRVDATDEDAWNRFRRYFQLISPGAHFIRRSLFASLLRNVEGSELDGEDHPFAGDDLLPDAVAQISDDIAIHASPAEIFPWLLEMTTHRAGFYGIDAVDHVAPSASAAEPTEMGVAVGDMLPSATDRDDAFEVLRVDRDRSLVLGGLWDADKRKQLPFASSRPEHYWQVTWAFVLEPIDGATSRLHVRARASFLSAGPMYATWIRPVHRFIERKQLEQLAATVEGRVSRRDWHAVVEGLGGLARIAGAFLTPHAREARSHWGLDAAAAARTYPGDELVENARWGFTHGVEVAAPAAEVWPWLAQIGADKGGFYSYEWLENLAGCGVHNAEVIHPEWSLTLGDGVVLHPDMPALPIVALSPGRYFVACVKPDRGARDAGAPWVEVSWLFMVESLDAFRCRIISRYRCAMSDEVRTRLQYGPTLLEPIGFAMDRRMLLGIRDRAERREPSAVKASRRGTKRGAKRSARQGPSEDVTGMPR